MIQIIATLIYLLMPIWGAVQFALYREADWLVLAIAALVFWDGCYKRHHK